MKKAILYIVIVLMNLSFACAKESKLPRPEYPRPQLKRLEWINLNGQWTYTFDFGQSGMNRKLYNSQGFENFITVPFCPESKLSGVGYTDFIPAMWYHRSIQIPDSWKGKQVILHFGAIDYYSVIYIDGKVMKRHWGGSSSFDVNITTAVSDGKPHHLVVRVEDNCSPDGIWTAPTDNDLKRDIELSMAAGFNGARLHQKVFEERYHYWADRLGYLTWGESASWGVSTSSPEAARNFLSEWSEIVERDRNHPSIICWTPFNETWDRPNNIEQAAQHDRLIADTYRLCHLLDNRPVNDASGNYHVITDIWSVHHYAQNGPEMKKRLEPQNGIPTQKDVKMEVRYNGQPYFIDEYGGIKWVSGKQFSQNSWGVWKRTTDIGRVLCTSERNYRCHSFIQTYIRLLLYTTHRCRTRTERNLQL